MVGIHVRFEQFPTPYAGCDTSDHLSPFFTEKTPENAKPIENLKQLDIVPWIGHTRLWENWGQLNDVEKRGAPKRKLLSDPNTLRWTWYFFGNLRTDHNFCKQVGMPMLGIHAWFERLLTPYARCDTSGHLSAFFDRENSRKCKICRKPKQLGMMPWIRHTIRWKK